MILNPFGAPAQHEIIPLTREEIVMLSKLHEFAAKHKLTIVCQRCDSSIRGQNNASSEVLAVACKCREFQYRHSPG